MTVRAIRALALAGTMALLAACTSSTTASAPSPTASSVPSSTPLVSPSPSPSSGTGASWEVATGVDAVSSSFVVATMGVCRGPRYDARCRQHLMATQDEGRTWYELTPPGRPQGAALEYPDFLDPATGWVVASNCSGGRALLYRTTDGGRTWATTKAGYHTCNAGARIVPDFVDPMHGWLLHVEPTAPFAVLERTTDGGTTWRRVGPRMQGAPARVAFTSTTTGWMSGLQEGHGVLARSTDGGRTWSQVGLPPPPKTVTSGTPYPDVPTALADGSLVEPVTYRRPNGATLVFDRSTDGGATWSVVRTWSGHAGHRSPLWSGLDVAIAGPDAFWFAPGPGATVIRSAGSGWSTVQTGGAALAGIASANPSVAWVLRHDGRALVLERVGPHGTKEMTPWPASASPTLAGMTPIATLPAWPAAVAGTAEGVYVALSDGSRTRVERIDPTTGRTAATVTVPHGSTCGCGDVSLASTGTRVWLLIGMRRAFLVGLQPATLHVKRTEPIAYAARGLAATASGLWVGRGDHVVLRDAATAAPMRSIAFPGPVTRVAASQDGADLYVTLGGPIRHFSDPLLEVDTATGAVVARTYAGVSDLDGVSVLAPVRDGVWVGAPSGMMGSLALLRAGTLAQVAGPIGGSNAIAATFAGGRLWITDAQRLTCNAPETGRTLGSPGLPGQDDGTIVQAGSVVVGAFGKTLYRIDPSVAC
ncbi:MAG: YCF48-related protein [Planctomycetaceae bacterium]